MKLFSRNLIFYTLVALTVVINLQLQLTSAIIGANLGLIANNLPTPDDVVAQYKAENILLLRIFEPHSEILHALRGSNIKVAIGVKNEDITSIAMNVNTAMEWVNSNVVPYTKDVNIGWIAVGNEMVPSTNANLISQAMNNILSGLNSVGLTQIKISTVVHSGALGNSSPPSSGTFSPEAKEVMQGIVPWLAGTNNPLLINVYPYIAYASEPGHIALEYALFDAQQPIIDGQYKYYSLFEAMVDAFYAALEKVGGGNVSIVVTETGWPNAGNDPFTSKQNAQSYNQNLINKMKSSGTPRRPSSILDIFIFSMYNENQKPRGVEQNWGIHYANKSSVYPLRF